MQKLQSTQRAIVNGAIARLLDRLGLASEKTIKHLDPLYDTRSTQVSRQLRKALKDVANGKTSEVAVHELMLEGTQARIDWTAVSPFERLLARRALHNAVHKAPPNTGVLALIELDSHTPTQIRLQLDDGWAHGEVTYITSLGFGCEILPYVVARIYRPRDASDIEFGLSIVESIYDATSLHYLDALTRFNASSEIEIRLRTAAERAYEQSLDIYLATRHLIVA